MKLIAGYICSQFMNSVYRRLKLIDSICLKLQTCMTLLIDKSTLIYPIQCDTILTKAKKAILLFYDTFNVKKNRFENKRFR